MTENASTAPEAVPTGAAPEAQEGAGTPEASERLSEGRKAAQYRHRAKYAEASREAAEERAALLERQEVERALTDLIDAEDFWASYQLDDLRDEAGQIVADRIDAAVAQLRERKPHYFRAAETATFTARTGDETRGRPAGHGVTWDEALKGK